MEEAARGKRPARHERCRDQTRGSCERHGIKNGGEWTNDAGEDADRLSESVALEDGGHRERAWEAFRTDPEWQKVRAESEVDGPLTARVFNTLLSPTDYSPLQ